MHGGSLPLLVALAFVSAAHAIATPRPPLRQGAVPQHRSTPPALQPIHVMIDGRWYDVADWADSHPGGRYVLEWADGFDISGAFHTIHLFGSGKAAEVLKRMPEADLSSRPSAERVLPQIDRSHDHGGVLTGMDKFMNVGERAIQLVSPPADTLPSPVPVAAAADLSWQQPSANVVGESALKRDLEALLRKHFRSPAEYKATPEHWARIIGAIALWGVCFAGWLQCSTAATLLMPFAQVTAM